MLFKRYYNSYSSISGYYFFIHVIALSDPVLLLHSLIFLFGNLYNLLFHLQCNSYHSFLCWIRICYLQRWRSKHGYLFSLYRHPLSIHLSPPIFFSENQRLEEIETAFLGHDFETFGKITMQDSNQFHAVCQDTYPPIFYMNDMSKSIIRLVHVINAHFGCIKAAYTFDAGPNAVIYCLDEVIVNL